MRGVAAVAESARDRADGVRRSLVLAADAFRLATPTSAGAGSTRVLATPARAAPAAAAAEDDDDACVGVGFRSGWLGCRS